MRMIDGGPRPSGTSVFILFDTSNRMYRWFSYVYDSIRDFVRTSIRRTQSRSTLQPHLLRAAAHHRSCKPAPV